MDTFVPDPVAMEAALAILGDADGLLVCAGAGMGADSGLPTFRGPEGLWRAYPALGRAGLEFTEIANPAAFRTTPELAWGFYGHRLDLYRRTAPHEGFGLLLRMGAATPTGAFVVTSNVDGHFQRAGFDEDRVFEAHGSIEHLQCLDDCEGEIWPAGDLRPVVDEDECRLLSPLPRCPACGALARPNIVMFGDWEWNGGRSNAQESRLWAWLDATQRPAVLEIGAGTSIPTVRAFAERRPDRLIRINPDHAGRLGSCAALFSCGAVEALRTLCRS
jgi:NAD-dependent SIR2 family protein deacetylase